MTFDHDHIARYPEDRPERALLRWCEAIACRNYRQAVRLSSLAATRGAVRALLPKDFEDNQALVLRRWWSGRMINRVEIHSTRMTDALELAAEITLTLHCVEIRSGRPHALPPERVRLWCYRVDDMGRASRQGRWGVDFMSMKSAGGIRV